MTGKAKRTSKILAELSDSCVEEDAITVEQFIEKLGHRAQALAILVFSLSAIIAGIVPGFSTLVGVPIIFIAIQIVLGRSGIGLPKKIRQKPISPSLVRGSLQRALPTLRKVEKFLRPRLTLLLHPVAERFVAFIIMVLAIILSLPIPGGNFLPSMSIAVLALALLEKDGLLLLLAVGSIFFTGGLMIELIDQAIIYTGEFIDWLF